MIRLSNDQGRGLLSRLLVARSREDFRFLDSDGPNLEMPIEDLLGQGKLTEADYEVLRGENRFSFTPQAEIELQIFNQIKASHWNPETFDHVIRVLSDRFAGNRLSGMALRIARESILDPFEQKKLEIELDKGPRCAKCSHLFDTKKGELGTILTNGNTIEIWCLNCKMAAKVPCGTPGCDESTDIPKNVKNSLTNSAKCPSCKEGKDPKAIKEKVAEEIEGLAQRMAGIRPPQWRPAGAPRVNRVAGRPPGGLNQWIQDVRANDQRLAVGIIEDIEAAPQNIWGLPDPEPDPELEGF